MILRIEICGVQVCGEASFEGGPVGINDGEPSGVSIVAFIMRAVTEYAFELKAQTLCCDAGLRVEAVTFLLVAAIAEVIEDMSHHQIHCFG